MTTAKKKAVSKRLPPLDESRVTELVDSSEQALTAQAAINRRADREYAAAWRAKKSSGDIDRYAPSFFEWKPG